MTNALKHAFPAGAGLIEVNIRSSEDAILFEVADDGVGLPAGFSMQATSSIGMEIVLGLVEQAGATIEIVCRPKGAMFRVTVPRGDANDW